MYTDDLKRTPKIKIIFSTVMVPWRTFNIHRTFQRFLGFFQLFNCSLH